MEARQGQNRAQPGFGLRQPFPEGQAPQAREPGRDSVGAHPPASNLKVLIPKALKL